MNLTELAGAMGYRGITQKLKRTVEELLTENRVSRCVGEDHRVKFTIGAR